MPDVLYDNIYHVCVHLGSLTTDVLWWKERMLQNT